MKNVAQGPAAWGSQLLCLRSGLTAYPVSPRCCWEGLPLQDKRFSLLP